MRKSAPPLSPKKIRDMISTAKVSASPTEMPEISRLFSPLTAKRPEINALKNSAAFGKMISTALGSGSFSAIKVSKERRRKAEKVKATRPLSIPKNKGFISFYSFFILIQFMIESKKI